LRIEFTARVENPIRSVPISTTKLRGPPPTDSDVGAGLVSPVSLLDSEPASRDHSIMVTPGSRTRRTIATPDCRTCNRASFPPMQSMFLLSEALRREFETQIYISMSRLAELLPMAPKTRAQEKLSLPHRASRLKAQWDRPVNSNRKMHNHFRHFRLPTKNATYIASPRAIRPKLTPSRRVTNSMLPFCHSAGRALWYYYSHAAPRLRTHGSPYAHHRQLGCLHRILVCLSVFREAKRSRPKALVWRERIPNGARDRNPRLLAAPVGSYPPWLAAGFRIILALGWRSAHSRRDHARRLGACVSWAQLGYAADAAKRP
jgi:hypothetical protein